MLISRVFQHPLQDASQNKYLKYLYMFWRFYTVDRKNNSSPRLHVTRELFFWIGSGAQTPSDTLFCVVHDGVSTLPWTLSDGVLVLPQLELQRNTFMANSRYMYSYFLFHLSQMFVFLITNNQKYFQKLQSLCHSGKSSFKLTHQIGKVTPISEIT